MYHHLISHKLLADIELNIIDDDNQYEVWNEIYISLILEEKSSITKSSITDSEEILK